MLKASSGPKRFWRKWLKNEGADGDTKQNVRQFCKTASIDRESRSGLISGGGKITARGKPGKIPGLT